MKVYHQITEKERYLISHLRKLRYNQSEIARQLGRHRSSISREFSRNSKNGRIYRPSKAQERANGRRSRSRKKPQFTPSQMDLVWHYIRQQWSPEQVSGYLRLQGVLRREVGHWEIDTVMGASNDTHCILTMVERDRLYPHRKVTQSYQSCPE